MEPGNHGATPTQQCDCRLAHPCTAGWPWGALTGAPIAAGCPCVGAGAGADGLGAGAGAAGAGGDGAGAGGAGAGGLGVGAGGLVAGGLPPPGGAVVWPMVATAKAGVASRSATMAMAVRVISVFPFLIPQRQRKELPPFSGIARQVLACPRPSPL